MTAVDVHAARWPPVYYYDTLILAHIHVKKGTTKLVAVLYHFIVPFLGQTMRKCKIIPPPQTCFVQRKITADKR